ncbi:MAG TPA: DNA polymerase IV [Candidatus Acidoferrales bacterium]|nr:DNA polymerase IV [Candidatus Acidoferrales bacterium]
MPKLASFRAKREPPRGGAARRAGDGATAILHVDMDAFFVSVELLDRPELRGKPVVVGGQPDQRGVVSAASYEARRYGIQSAMPLRTAGRLCPDAVFLELRHELYSEWSDRIATILARYSPRVEMASVDEAYLDLAGTERLLGHPLAAAHRLRKEIWEKTKLPSSIGVARTRLVAKVASDQAKPAGLLWIPAGSEAAFLALLAVRKIPGIGPVTEGALRGLGIETVGQLALVPRERLEEVFGQWGGGLYRKARGEDTYEFLDDAEAKSISHHHTFSEDVQDLATIESTLSHLCQKAAKRLRDAGLFAGTVTLTLRYTGFETITRARTLASPTDLDQDILRTARELLARHRDARRRVRLVGISLTSFSHGEKQLELLDPARREKLEKLARASDKLRERFGFDKLQLGGSVGRPQDH